MTQPELCDDPIRAADILRAGGLVAFPTETVYGLGVDATNANAVERLFLVKGRPANNPLIVHIADAADLESVCERVPAIAVELLRHFAPGPLTVVVPKRPEIARSVTAGLSTVGVRIPNEARTRAMLRAVARPIAAPSANRSGRPSSTTYQSVIEDFGAEIDAILIGEPASIGLESTVVDCTRDVLRILRPGAVTVEQLRQFDPRITLAGKENTIGENSPGRLHPHYRPDARVELVDHALDAIADRSAAYIGLEPHPLAKSFGWHCQFDTLDDYARAFYETLREVDRRGLGIVYCQQVPDSGLALRDRLERAAEC